MSHKTALGSVICQFCGDEEVNEPLLDWCCRCHKKLCDDCICGYEIESGDRWCEDCLEKESNLS